jgi:hypothetical protein
MNKSHFFYEQRKFVHIAPYYPYNLFKRYILFVAFQLI